MRIALAQIQPHQGDISANIQKHLQFIEQAIAARAQAIFFPELSLSAYEPNLAQELAINLTDERLQVFQNSSDQTNISISVGAPIQATKGVQIGMLIFQPQRPPQLYAKQLLHEDEFPFFVSGDQQIMLEIEGNTIAPAICYESLQVEHATQAHQLGATIYLASVAKSQKGIDKAAQHYPAIAQQYQMPVLMVNSVGFCDNFMSAGQSAIWDKTGKLLAQLDDQTENLLIFG